MSKPVTTDEKTKIIEGLRAGMNRNEAAREFGRAPGTISKIAKEAGISFDRSQTKAATEAKQADNAARRAELVEKLYSKAHDLVDATDQPFLLTNFGGRENTYNEHLLNKPTDGAIRNYMVSLGIAVQRAVELEAVDKDGDDHGQIDALVDAIGKMRIEYRAQKEATNDE